MNKCLRINIVLQEVPKDFLQNGVQKYAHKFKIEGTAQAVDGINVKIIACGEKEQIDLFLDAVHREIARFSPKDIQIEPFLKEKDYRGVFRIIE